MIDPKQPDAHHSTFQQKLQTEGRPQQTREPLDAV